MRSDLLEVDGPDSARQEQPSAVGSGPAADGQQVLRRTSGLRDEEWAEYGVAAVVGVHIAALLRLLLDWDGLLGTALVGLVAFVVIHGLVVRERATPEIALDRAVTTVMWVTGVLVLSILVWIVATIVVKGLVRLRWSFLTEDLSDVGPLNPGGGALHAIVGSFVQVGLATAVVVPVAVLTAVYLNEVRGRMATPIRFIIDALSGLPSIVAGLLVFTILPGYAGYKASIALFVLALPIVTRTSEEVLRTVPDSLREASLALGAPQWRVVMRVVLPTARAGLLTAVLLAVARITGETAPVLLTAGLSSSTNVNPSTGPMTSLPVLVFDLIRVPDRVQNERAWAGALVLLIIVVIAFVAARMALARSEKRLGRR